MPESHAVAAHGGGSFGAVIGNTVAAYVTVLPIAEADRPGVHLSLVNGLKLILHEHRPAAEVFDDMMHTEQAVDVEFVTR